jgi:hypothetical protein
MFTARKPSEMTYSYKELSASKLETIQELLKCKTQHSRTDDVSMTKIGLCLNKIARARNHDRSSMINNNK